MAKSPGQKTKLLHLIGILEDYSDEEHPVSTKELIARLEQKGIHSERKSIYDDVETLRDFGYDIINVPSRNGGGYYLASREFELPELKLLVDAVQASRFITSRKSRELIGKLEKKAGKYDAGKLQRQVFVVGRVKTENESIYYNIDNIHRGIQEDRQISFRYMDWNLNKRMVARDRKIRQVSPWALIWQDENYYLAAFDEEDGIIKHYRVDKMGSVAVTEEKRAGKEQFEKLDPASYSNAAFGMYGGEEETVTMIFPNRLVGVVLDRFGKDVEIRSEDAGHFRVRAKVMVSGQFFGWLAGIGSEARLSAPESVRNEYQNWIRGIQDSFRQV